MKKNIFLLTVFIMMCVTLPATSPSSLAFSNSYLQRASGIEALYWNPANIHKMTAKHQLSFFPFAFSFEEPSFLWYEDTCKRIIGKKLSNDSVDEYINLKINTNGIFTGYSYKNFAVSYGYHIFSNKMIDFEFMILTITGETNNKTNHFTSKHNDFSYLEYKDLTLGYGGFRINNMLEKYLENLPDIYGGVSISYLDGANVFDLRDYNYLLEIDTEERYSLNRQSIVRSANGGHGIKMSFGLSSDVYETKREGKISVGVSVDNMLGFINWNKDAKDTYYRASFENLILSNYFFEKVIKLSQVEDVADKEIDSFTQKLPTIFKLGTVYSKNAMSVSLDFSKTSNTHGAYDSNPQLSAGFEYNFFGWLPIQMGCRFPIADSPALYSLGLGLRRERFELGLGCQGQDDLFESKIFPSLGVAMQLKFMF